MFERRTDLTRLVAAAETGQIGLAADRTNVTQPTLTRDIARLEARLGGRLFDRMPDGVRLTPLGAVAVEHAKRILRETADAERAVAAARSGRAGTFRITATPPWTETVLAAAAARFHEAFPAVGLAIESASRSEGLRRLAAGRADLHCGGIDAGEALPGLVRRETFLELTAGIVAWRGHPLLDGPVRPGDLARHPWIDFDWQATPERAGHLPSLGSILERLGAVAPVLRLGAAGLFALARGPWLAWLSIELLDCLPDGPVRPVPVEIGRFRYRTGFLARRSAEDLPPFRALEQAVRDAALGRSPGRMPPERAAGDAGSG
ncbi:MAG: LysR family transcriptional regulator [Boseongicola sp. SB0662_bin_57]|nr:LysR family transcriptional regulator [Boseongicola sp. SB0662_bin_57]